MSLDARLWAARCLAWVGSPMTLDQWVVLMLSMRAKKNPEIYKGRMEDAVNAVVSVLPSHGARYGDSLPKDIEDRLVDAIAEFEVQGAA